MNRDEQLAQLREQLEQAKTVYDGAKRDYDRAVDLMRDLGKAHPDGSIRPATRAVTHALQDYKKALNDFNNFLLRNISPSLENPSTQE